MPLKVKPSKRLGFKPMVYFKGSLEELKNAGKSDFSRFSDVSGHKIKDPENFKSQVCRIAKSSEFKRNNKAYFWVPLEKGNILVLVSKGHKSSRILLRQHPFIHVIGFPTFKEFSNFRDLLNILKSGFKGKESPNVLITLDRKFAEIANRDLYWISLLSEKVKKTSRLSMPSAFVESADPNQILRINIALDRNATPKQRSQKIAFYREKLKGWPLQFTINKK